MRTEPTAPWWLAAAVTAIPILLAVLLVVLFHPGHRTLPPHSVKLSGGFR